MSRLKCPIYPSRVEGWLDVFDPEPAGIPSKLPKKPPYNWEPLFCVLIQDEQTFASYCSEELSLGALFFGSELPRVRLDSRSPCNHQPFINDDVSSSSSSSNGSASILNCHRFIIGNNKNSSSSSSDHQQDRFCLRTKQATVREEDEENDDNDDFTLMAIIDDDKQCGDDYRRHNKMMKNSDFSDDSSTLKSDRSVMRNEDGFDDANAMMMKIRQQQQVGDAEMAPGDRCVSECVSMGASSDYKG
ncbi:uncharacterized protein LOC113372286 [Ctenocephalides felis]|uniref:uncharacterized protein LOC113372286 n=1 Tax=Ctenocephalides felis TaxID=7515 RepID=UPI000E6E380A|nr:uncharacterized protein LOC113372286 [Ctenocephalides felis]